MIHLTAISCLICVFVCDARAAWRGLSPSTEYGAPPAQNIQISKENVEFSGQTVEIAPQNANYAYTPAHTQFQQSQSTKTPNEEYLPREAPPKPFRPVVNTGKTIIFPESSQLRLPVFIQSSRLQYNPNAAIFSATQQLPQLQQIGEFSGNRNDQFQRQQTYFYAPPQTNLKFEERRFGADNVGEVSQQPQQSQQPGQHKQSQQPRQPQKFPEFATNCSDPSQEQQTYSFPTSQTNENYEQRGNGDAEDLSEETTETTVVAVANANGQYYILGKDNTLQRVMYVAGQTEDDIINNGFTAQLRYTQVEPIRDPVYGYDDQGQLIRVFNKK